MRRTDEDISGAGVYDERRAESVKIMEDQGSIASNVNDLLIAHMVDSYISHLAPTDPRMLKLPLIGSSIAESSRTLGLRVITLPLASLPSDVMLVI